MTSPSERISALDGLRGLAILMVMIHHFTFLNSGNHFGALVVKGLHLGGHGVDLFFILSGFLITTILLDNRERPNYFKNFYARRCLRIFPLYYCFLSFSLFFLPFLLRHVPATAEQLSGFLSARDHWQWYFFYLSNIWIALKGYYSRGGIDITWSLAIEEHFYLLWPFFVRFLTIKSLHRLCFGIIAAAFFFRLFLFIRGAGIVPIQVLTFTRMDTIAFGALIATALKMPMTNNSLNFFSTHRNLCLSLFLLFVLFLTGLLNEESFFFNTFGYGLIAVFFTLLLISVIKKNLLVPFQRIFDHPFLIFFGKYSYAMYLLHIPVGSALLTLLIQQIPVDPLAKQILFYPFATLTVILFALLSWHFLEKPVLELKKYFPMRF